LREAAPRFKERGARIAVVGQGLPDAMDEFCASRGVDGALICVSDPERAAYDAFGLERRGDLNDVMGPKILGAGIKAFRFGVGLPGKGQDIRQLGGAFVIDRDGTLRLAQRAATSADRATVDQLLAALP
jgi:alkyl-hydroperoxide reductase/thiol specific antioxidant family protein